MSAEFDVAILGAGASGLFAAYILENGAHSVLVKNPYKDSSKQKKLKNPDKNLSAPPSHKSPNFCVIDANSSVGKKLQISGGRRCNFTNQNLTNAHFIGDGALIERVFSRFGNDELLGFLRAQNLDFVKIKNSQYFCERKSSDLISILTREIAPQRFILNRKILHVKKVENGYKITTQNGEIFARATILATGALSFPILGASGVGYEIAENLGHKITPLSPGLVGLTLQSSETWLKSLSGISLKARAKVAGRELCGDILFTHRGISGPLILDSSLFWERGNIELTFLENPLKFLGKTQSFITSELPLPRRFTKALLEKLEIKDQKFCTLTKEQKDTLLNALLCYTFAPAGNLGYTKAEVTRGGIVTSDFEPDTLESRLSSGFFAAGEVLDVTGMLGGYNLQWAFSSAFVAASAALKWLRRIYEAR